MCKKKDQKGLLQIHSFIISSTMCFKCLNTSLIKKIFKLKFVISNINSKKVRANHCHF